MLGLVLEGGGAKGSYHAGAIKALIERKYEFDGVMGTSIGALNGALVAQGDAEKCIELWENAMPSDFVDVDDEKMVNILSRKIDKEAFFYLLSLLRNALANKGFSRERIMNLMRCLIDEDKLRQSDKDFGIVTVSITDKAPLEIFKEEIPYGHLHDYIMASAYIPGFRRDKIYGKKYFDGGVYDNLPINPLIRKGYDEIIAVRTNSSMPHRTVVDDTVKITYINPSASVGGTVSMYKSSLERNIRMGYYDAIRALDGHKGKLYYFRNEGASALADFFLHIDKNAIDELRTLFDLPEDSDKQMVIKKLFSQLRSHMKDTLLMSDYEVLLAVLEKCAEKCGLDRFCLHDIDSMVKSIKNHFDSDTNVDIISINNIRLRAKNKILIDIMEILLKNYH